MTERVKAEEDLRRSEEKFRTLIENVVDWVWQVDPDGTYTYVSPQAERILGYDTSEIVGRTPFELMSPEEAERVGAIFADIHARRDRIGGLEDTMIGRDGREVIFETNATPLFDKDGELAGYMGTCRDITDRKRAAQALRESEERYRSLVENMQVGVALVDQNMKLLSFNRQFREWFPEAGPETSPKCFEVLRTPAGVEACPGCCVKQTLSDDSVQERVVTIETAHGSRDIREVSSPVNNGGDKPVAATLILEDITDRMRMEKELAKAEKLESIGVLAGGIAHDFNNILVAILGNISLARMELDQDSEVNAMLTDAEHASERARDLTQQLLTFSKGGAPITRSTDIQTLIRDSATFTLRGSNSRCEFAFADDLWHAEVDAGQFSQVIGNLVLNAAQAMPQGGVVTIGAENFSISHSSVLPLRPGDYVRITVSDNGVGIKPEVLARIFDPFFTTKDMGNGLGLTSCYSIVKRHGGHIDVSSQPDSGATFSVYMPASVAGIGTAYRDTGELIEGSGRVLVIDDETSVLNLAAHLLKRLGYEPSTATNGSDAIRMAWEARSAGAPFNAAIIDLTIPGGMGGVEILRQLKRIEPDVKAFVSSGYYNDPIMSQFAEHGFVGRIAKPYKAEEFSRALSEVLNEVTAED
jgi:PAS domain S-box-containing protein